MPKHIKWNETQLLSLTLIVFLCSPVFLLAQKKETKRKHEIYFSWGYNEEWYTHSTIHISQPNLGNDYQLNSITARDHPGWDEGIFNRGITVPQFNVRVGYVFNEENGWIFELNYDHPKFIVNEGNVHLTGRLNKQPVDTTVMFTQANGYHYYLNNGANFFLFDIVKRLHMYKTRDEKFKLDFLAKFGVGFTVPHVDNELFGHTNVPHFQIGGWNTGVEAAIRATFFRYVYLEYGNKLDYARYSGLGLYEGTAHQAFGTYEMMLSLGLVFPAGKKIN
ncbi:MAG TPA: hypothetical protein VKR32_08335 [Puia sp.]|nr:hypothetical protein [Puia sp.]